MSKKNKKQAAPPAPPSLVVTVEENAKTRREALEAELQSLIAERQKVVELQSTLSRRIDQVSGALNELNALLKRG